MNSWFLSFRIDSTNGTLDGLVWGWRPWTFRIEKWDKQRFVDEAVGFVEEVRFGKESD